MYMTDFNQRALELHEKHKGKITISLRDTDELDRDMLSSYYSPGVGAVSRAIADDTSLLPKYTWTNNLVAVISNGSAVLGLGNIGPEAAMPVMEGKALLFKRFANIDSVPIVIKDQTADDIVTTIASIAPSFGAINLEDIAAPICFDVEDRLKAALPIPVFHDDQHGTAIVVLAGLINAMKVSGKSLENCKIVLVGSGAAGIAIAKLLHQYAKPTIIATDSKGIISEDRSDLNQEKQVLLSITNPDNVSGSLTDAVRDADIFIGVSKPNLLTQDMVRSMATDPIIFALANPVPEIMPDDAKAAGALIVATGRSDYPNQVNNAVAFPGIFRGALDNHVRAITDAHKIAAAEVIASLVVSPTSETIIPSVFDERLVPEIAKVITP